MRNFTYTHYMQCTYKTYLNPSRHNCFSENKEEEKKLKIQKQIEEEKLKKPLKQDEHFKESFKHGNVIIIRLCDNSKA